MKRAWVVALLGCLLMAGSVAGYWQFMKHTQFQVATMETVKPVRMLHSGEVIEASMLRRAIIPVAAHHPEAVTDAGSLIGQTVLVPIADNEELVLWKLSDRRLVPKEGERYFSFKTDAAANVGNMVRKGDRVDVWVEFEAPKLIKTASGAVWSVGAVKVIEQLPVTGVKTPEGPEVTDASTVEAVVQSNRQQLQNTRSKPNGKPELNTYLMNDEVYEAFVLGSIAGRIKLALPDLTEPGSDSGAVTGLFRELKAADAFTQTKEQIQVRGELDQRQVSGNGNIETSLETSLETKEVQPSS